MLKEYKKDFQTLKKKILVKEAYMGALHECMVRLRAETTLEEENKGFLKGPVIS